MYMGHRWLEQYLICSILIIKLLLICWHIRRIWQNINIKNQTSSSNQQCPIVPTFFAFLFCFLKFHFEILKLLLFSETFTFFWELCFGLGPRNNSQHKSLRLQPQAKFCWPLTTERGHHKKKITLSTFYKNSWGFRSSPDSSIIIGEL